MSFPRRPQAAEPFVPPVSSRPATTPPLEMAGRRGQGPAAQTRRRARRTEAGNPRNQSPPTAIAGRPRHAQSEPQRARGEPPLVAYKRALKPPTVDRVSDDAHVGVVVTDVLCAGLLVLRHGELC